MRFIVRHSWLPVLVAVAIAGACSADNEKPKDDDDGGGASTSATTGAGGFDPQTASSGTGTTCNVPGNVDNDGDGFTGDEGDCNDCDPNVNPHAIEVIVEGGPEADENCDGVVDEPRTSCDSGLGLTDTSAESAARAIELCETVDTHGFGLVSAAYVRTNGTPYSSPGRHVGLMEGFGSNVVPRQGDSMLVLSSGFARAPGQPDACGGVSCGAIGAGTAPAGFPQDVPSCNGSQNIYDDIALEVALRAPTNATGILYEFSFYSHEYPEWVCTSFNDQFIALVTPPPAGSINGNISFDAATNPVSVNIALFEVCSGCSLGTNELLGTGFDTWGFNGIGDAGATGWLQTTAPVEPGQDFTIRFAIWDTGDSAYDSTVLIDNFTWIADGGMVSVGTAPVPK